MKGTKKAKVKNILLIIFISFIILICVYYLFVSFKYGMYYSSKKSSALDYNIYNFNVNAGYQSEHLQLYNFIIYYDFDSDKGFIEFKPEGEDEIERIGILLPHGMEVTSCSADSEDLFKETDDCRNLPFNKVKGKTVLINFSDYNNNFYPNGLFFINTEANITTYKNVDIGEKAWTTKRPRMLFNLGKYKCNAICFTNAVDCEGKIGSKNEIYLIAKDNTIHSEIELHTFDSNIEFNKTLWLSISTAIAIGLVFFFLNILLNWMGVINKESESKEVENKISSIKKYIEKVNRKGFNKINNALDCYIRINKNSFKKLNENLKKIENKIKPTKTKSKKTK